jgi:lysophospholipase L1-like esterase
MTTVLVYGDSNTWGQTARSNRYDYDKLWTTKLQQHFDGEVKVYSAGVSGRIAGSYDHVPAVKRGKDSFEVVYRQAFPVDTVIIALGTNDIKDKYDISADNIVRDLAWYAEQLNTWTAYDDTELSPHVLFVLPPNFDQQKFQGSETKRQEVMQQMENAGYTTLRLDDIEMGQDGVHFSEAGHTQAARLIYDKLKEMAL